MKIDPKMFAGFTCALGLHAALFTIDLPKNISSNTNTDLLFEQSYSSVEVSFAAVSIPKPKEEKPLKQEKQKIKEIKKEFIKPIETPTQKPDIVIQKEVKEEKPEKEKPKEIEKSVLKENRGVVSKTTEPVRIYNQAPIYPLFAVRMNYEGTVILALSINEKGKVTSISIKQSSGHPLLDNSAKEAAKNWKFSPAKKDGINILYVKEVPVSFRLKNK